MVAFAIGELLILCACAAVLWAQRRRIRIARDRLDAARAARENWRQYANRLARELVKATAERDALKRVETDRRTFQDMIDREWSG